MSRVTDALQSVTSLSAVQMPLFFDCGSTVTRVFFNGTVVLEEPTCVALHSQTGAVVAMGKKAESLLGKVSDRFQVVFPVQYGEVTNPDTLIAFLNAVTDQVVTARAAKTLGVPVVVAVPTNTSPVQKTIYAETFKKAGFRSVRLVSQAQALLFELGGEGKNESFCYFSLGGQKSECAIFTLDEMIQSTTFRTGGVQLTEIVQREVRLEYNLEISWHVAESIKREVCTLASFVPGGKRIGGTKIAVRGKDVTTQAGKTVVVSSTDFSEAFGQVVEELLDELQFFFSTVPAHLVAASLESGIFITGGLSQMPGVKELLESTFSAPVELSSNPSLDVVKGVVKGATT